PKQATEEEETVEQVKKMENEPQEVEQQEKEEREEEPQKQQKQTEEEYRESVEGRQTEEQKDEFLEKLKKERQKQQEEDEMMKEKQELEEKEQYQPPKPPEKEAEKQEKEWFDKKREARQQRKAEEQEKDKKERLENLKNKLKNIQEEEDEKREEFLSKIKEEKATERGSRAQPQQEQSEGPPPSEPSSGNLQFEVPERPSSGKKIASRVLIVVLVILLLAGIGGLGYWFFAIRGEEPKGPEDYVTQQSCKDADFYWYDNACHEQEQEEEEVVRPKKPSDFEKETTCTDAGFHWYAATSSAQATCHEEPQPEPEPEPEPKPSASLIKVDQTKILTASSSEDISPVLNEYLQQELEKGFTRIIIKNEKKNEFSDLSSIFSVFEIKAATSFHASLRASSTFFVYTNEEKKRPGFITEVKENKNEDLSKLLSNWEPDMESDFESFYEILGYDGEPYSNSFTQGTHNQQNFRCQAFSREDLGICYAVTKNHLLFTSSWKGMEELIDLLKS
ncbi:MAG: hypothetical protein V5A57_00965, partial [Candidatus Paceibacterota bacterium]